MLKLEVVEWVHIPNSNGKQFSGLCQVILVFISLKVVKELLPYYKLGHIVMVLDQMEYLRNQFFGQKKKYWLGFAMAHLKKTSSSSSSSSS